MSEPRVRRPAKTSVTLRLSVPLANALRQHAEQETARLGYQVTQASVVTNALLANKPLEELYIMSRGGKSSHH